MRVAQLGRIGYLSIIWQVIYSIDIWRTLMSIWTQVVSLWDISFVDFFNIIIIVSNRIFKILWIYKFRLQSLISLHCRLRLFQSVHLLLLLLKMLTLLGNSLTLMWMSWCLLDFNRILLGNNIRWIELFLILNLTSRLINICACFLNILLITSLYIALR